MEPIFKKNKQKTLNLKLTKFHFYTRDDQITYIQCATPPLLADPAIRRRPSPFIFLNGN